MDISIPRKSMPSQPGRSSAASKDLKENDKAVYISQDQEACSLGVATGLEKSYPTLPLETNVIDWNGPDDPDNPQNWPRWLKVFHATMPGLFGFAV
jgi:hypothetical protein